MLNLYLLLAKLDLTKALKQAYKGGIVVISPLQLQILMFTYFSSLPASHSYEATEEDLKSEQCQLGCNHYTLALAPLQVKDIALTQVFTSNKAKPFTCSSIYHPRTGLGSGWLFSPHLDYCHNLLTGPSPLASHY